LLSGCDTKSNNNIHDEKYVENLQSNNDHNLYTQNEIVLNTYVTNNADIALLNNVKDNMINFNDLIELSDGSFSDSSTQSTNEFSLTIEELRRKGRLCKNSKPYESLLYFKRAYDKTTNETLKTKILFDIGDCYEISGNYDSYKEVLNTIIERGEKGIAIEYVGLAYFELGSLERLLKGDRQNVTDYFDMAADAYLNVKNYKGAAQSWNTIGMYYMNTKPEYAINYFNKVIQIKDNIDENRYTYAQDLLKKTEELMKPYNQDKEKIINMLKNKKQPQVIVEEIDKYLDMYPDSKHNKQLKLIKEDYEEVYDL
jgi:tetratricopeptide (TPR) repeat protein